MIAVPPTWLMSLHRKQRCEAEPLHARAADAEEADLAAEPPAKRLHQTGAERVARLFAGDQEGGKRRARFAAHASSPFAAALPPSALAGR